MAAAIPIAITDTTDTTATTAMTRVDRGFLESSLPTPESLSLSDRVGNHRRGIIAGHLYPYDLYLSCR